jgi:hypothetical protein
VEPEIDEIGFYQKQQQAINKYKLPRDIKPCIAVLLVSKIKEGYGHRRTEYGLIIATELRDLKLSETQIEKIIGKWNYEFVDPPVSQSQLRGILRQCFKKKHNGKYKYKYNPCNGKYADGLIQEGHCIGQEYCYYYRQHSSNKPRTFDYIATGWQHILTTREQVLLFAIRRLEQIKKVGPNKRLITDYRELSHQTGINKRYLKEVLLVLEAYGLIDVKIGKPQFWEHAGTEIKRIIPPKIPKRFIGKPKEFKRYVKQSIKALKIEQDLTIKEQI